LPWKALGHHLLQPLPRNRDISRPGLSRTSGRSQAAARGQDHQQKAAIHHDSTSPRKPDTKPWSAMHAIRMALCFLRSALSRQGLFPVPAVGVARHLREGASQRAPIRHRQYRHPYGNITQSFWPALPPAQLCRGLGHGPPPAH